MLFLISALQLFCVSSKVIVKKPESPYDGFETLWIFLFLSVCGAIVIVEIIWFSWNMLRYVKLAV